MNEETKAAKLIPGHEVPGTEPQDSIIALKAKLRELHVAIQRIPGDARCKSIACTELESAGTWAVKAFYFS